MNENTICNTADSALHVRLFIARLSFLRFGEKCRLEHTINALSELLCLHLDELSIKVGRVINTRLWNPEKIVLLVEQDIRLMRNYGVKVLFYDSANYPYLLKEIFDPPYALFYRGNSNILDKPSVAIVGTRKPTREGSIATKKIATRIVEAGIHVVSGLAFGIDAAAHTGSLLAQGSSLYGKTIAVLGSGVDNITPSSNKKIAGAILASGGCIISEYPIGSIVQNWHFVQRNRIISALSRVVLVMEAPMGSGSLITAEFAIEHNRELCFYKDIHATSQPNKNEQGIEGYMFTKKRKKSVLDYIQEGATIISDANDVLLLVNSMTFLEEREINRKKT